MTRAAPRIPKASIQSRYLLQLREILFDYIDTASKTDTTYTPVRMAAAQTVQPNQSLYVQNLPDRFQKDDLRRSLYMLFSTYGPVIDVTAMKTSSMRGQAHILFRDIQSANQAMRACQGSEFFGKQMVRQSKRRKCA